MLTGLHFVALWLGVIAPVTTVEAVKGRSIIICFFLILNWRYFQLPAR
jgi:hypothetical protein